MSRKPYYKYCKESEIDIEFKDYECEYYKIRAPKTSCFFCRYCTDIFFDFTNGPYMLMCDKGKEPYDDGVFGKCDGFDES